MKKFLSILLSVMMIVSVLAILASCNGNESTTTTATNAPETTTKAQETTTAKTDTTTTQAPETTTQAPVTTAAVTETTTAKTTTAETTTEAVVTTATEVTTTAEVTTTTAEVTTTAKQVETTTLPVFARFDFGTKTYAEENDLTSHEYLIGELKYDDSALYIDFSDDYWDIYTVAPYDSSNVTWENGALKNMRFGVVFNDLVTFDFDDEIVHGWGSWANYPYSQPTETTEWHGTHQYMQVRMVNNTTNNIWGIRYINTGDGTYYTTEVIGNLYLQGGEPTSSTDYRRTCTASDAWAVYTYDLMMVGGIAAGRGWSAVSGKDGKIDDGVDNYYDQVQMSYAKGKVGGSNISWQPKKGFTALEFNFFGGVYTFEYDVDEKWDEATKTAWETAQNHLKEACDTRENIVAGMNVKVDYIIFGCSPEQCDAYKSFMEQNS
ncbi:MAG: hypothetical protein K6F14_09205 [Clostridiales bacterium]|nr:hypothetical protein [Clostridiales bacterium]